MNMELASTAAVKSRAFLFSSPETFRKPKTWDLEPYTRNQKLRNRSLKPETRNTKRESQVARLLLLLPRILPQVKR